jgi:hypothetical protein
MRHQRILLGLLLALAVGCSNSPSPDVNQNPADTPPANQVAAQQHPTPPPPPPHAGLKPDERAMAVAGVTLDSVENPPPKPAAVAVKPTEVEAAKPRPGTELEKAGVGSGAKGRGLGQGIISTPVATYFAARERIFFDIQLPQFVRAFEFENERAPKSNEEYMEKIIKKNNIQLPQLPPGHRYVYDPKTKQLMVEKPRQ